MAVTRAGVLAALCALVLGGCGNDPAGSIEKSILEKAKGLVPAPKATPAAAAGAAQPSAAEAMAQLRQSLVDVGVPVLRVKIAALGADTFLTPRDRNSGTVSWQTADGSVFTFRDGVLIETRGAVSDLMSAAVPSAAQIRAGAGSHRRSYFVLGDEDATVRLDMDCTLSTLGTETVEVVGRGYATRHVRESCEGAGRTVQNDYWLDGDGGFRKSSQWVSDFIGNAEFQRVID